MIDMGAFLRYEEKMDHRQILLTALRVLADEAVRGSVSNRADELVLRNACEDDDRFLPTRQLARRIIDRESRALGWKIPGLISK